MCRSHVELTQHIYLSCVDDIEQFRDTAAIVTDPPCPNVDEVNEVNMDTSLDNMPISEEQLSVEEQDE